MPMNLSEARMVDPVLTELARGYVQPGLVGMGLFPQVPVTVRGGKRPQFGKEAFQNYNLLRQPGSSVRRITVTPDTVPFQLEGRGLGGSVPYEHQEEAQSANGLNLEIETMETVQEAIALDRERRQAAAATDASNYPASHAEALAGAAKWSDDGSNPVKAVLDLHQQVRGASGVNGNTLVLGPRVAARLKVHPKMLAYAQPVGGRITSELMGDLFEVDRVLVANAIQADDAGAFSDVWGDVAILAYVSPRLLDRNINERSRRTPTYGMTLTYEGHPAVEPTRWHQDSKSWVSDTLLDDSVEMTSAAAGCLLTAVL